MKGISLIETLVVLLATSILLGLSIAFIKPRSQSELAAHQLHQDLQWARWEAIRRQRPVLVCPPGEQQACSPVWNNIYHIYAQSPQGLELIKKGNLEVTEVVLKSSLGQPYLQFQPMGLCSQQGTFYLRDPISEHKLIFLRNGRIRLEQSSAATS